MGRSLDVRLGFIAALMILSMLAPAAAHAAPTYYTIMATAGAHGAISPSGAVQVKKNMAQTFAITPDAGCDVADVLVDGASAGAVKTYTFDKKTVSDHTISATFVAHYTITATAGAHGAISPAGSVRADSGSCKTFAITPEDGYRVSGVLVDGASAGAVTTYTFNDIAADHAISASFIANAPPTVATCICSGLSVSTATLNGSLSDLGSAASVKVSFQWGNASGDYPHETPPQSLNQQSGFSYDFSSLLNPGQVYYVRAKADGGPAGVSYGTETCLVWCKMTVKTAAGAPVPGAMVRAYAEANANVKCPAGPAGQTDAAGVAGIWLYRDNWKYQLAVAPGADWRTSGSFTPAPELSGMSAVVSVAYSR